MKLPRRNFLHLAAGAAALPAASGTTPVPPEPGPSPTVSKNFVTDFGAPTDGTSDCMPALARWLKFAAANPNAELMIPAGKFNFPSDSFAPFRGGQHGATIRGAGSSKTEILAPHGPYLGPPDVFIADTAHSASLSTANRGDTTITLKDATDASKFKIGGWICINGLSLMAGASYPPNIQYNEYRRVTAINGATISLDAPLQETYLDTWPKVHSTSTGASELGGPALAYVMQDSWDGVYSCIGFKLTSNANTFYGGSREIYNEDIVWHGTGPAGPNPSMTPKARYVNCHLGEGQCEIDKLIEYLEWNNCTGNSMLLQSTCIREMVFDHCTLNMAACSARNTTFRNGCHMKEIMAGSGFYGAAEHLTIQDSTIDGALPSYHYLLLSPSLSYSNGTFKVAKSDWTGRDSAFQNIVPGHTYIAGRYNGASNTHNEAGPDFKYKVLALREDANFIYWDTDRTEATLPPMTFGGGQPPTAHFCIPFFTVTETNYTGPSFAKLAYQTEL